MRLHTMSWVCTYLVTVKRVSSLLNLWKRGLKPRKVMTTESWEKKPANETNHLKVSKTKND